MVNLRKWSVTATGNASVAGGANTINFAEGQTPGSVNNSAREMMAQLRSVYTPSEWGWVENSATASVASQTTFKLAGNQTTDWVAPRRWRLKSGSTTRYGTVVSSSYTVETTVTVTVDSGSLSASHSLAALSPIDNVSNQLPSIRTDTVGRVGILKVPSADTLDVNGTGKFSDELRLANGLSMTNATADNIYHTTVQSFLKAGTGERFRIDSSGNVLVTGSGGLGYGTGSGGTVTQLTSKSTGVTLNKTNGQITMNNAALAAGASVLFSLSNSTVAATDTVIVHHNSGAVNNDNYRVAMVNVQAGTARIAVTNVSGGSLSEALVINFAVIKAVTA